MDSLNVTHYAMEREFRFPPFGLLMDSLNVTRYAMVCELRFPRYAERGTRNLRYA